MTFKPLLAAILLAVPSSADEPQVCEVPVLKIEGPIDGLSSIGPIVGLRLAALKKYSHVDVVIDSPGGDLGAAVGIIAAMKGAQKAGTEVRCTVRGRASSAAAIILEAGCSTRRMSKSSYLLFHEVYYGEPQSAQKMHEFYDYANGLYDSNKYVAVLIAWRMGMSADEYMTWVGRRDRFVDATEALQRGFVDSIE